MLDSKHYESRIEGLRGFLVEKDTDFALVTPSPSFQYLTGAETEMTERLVALVITSDSDPMIVAPAFEVSGLAQRTWIKGFLPWEEDEDPYAVISGWIGKKDVGYKAAFDDSLPVGIYWRAERALGRFRDSLSLASVVERMRLVKSPDELKLMKEAGRVITKAVTKAYESAEVGMTELELSRVVSNEVVRKGAKPTFTTVQFGENSALPHAGSGKRQMKKGDIVLMDCGCTVDGYNTDMTRVGVVGDPSEEQEAIYEVVREAQSAALREIQEGLACGKADGIARRVIEESGYAENFTHRLGHGIGIEVHEPPYLVRGNSLELKSGMTHSVEPGIYLEGHFGIRIEDLVCVHEEGCEEITYAPKDMFIIEPT
ncbi:MAG: aminopeptidase P family protein [Candidatus Thorarchaeota archaeon]|nr:MAG: aminopeptidase P family protein [Candidatus Thorarchaeota archaeon]